MERDDSDPPDRSLDSGVRRRARTRSPAFGTAVPAVYVVEHPSGRMEAAALEVADPEEAFGSLGRIVDTIIERRTARKLRGLKAGIITALIGAIGALAGVSKGALDAREAAGVDKARMRQLEVEVDRLRSAVFPPPPPYWRRDDAPPPPAPQMRAPDPAQRGPLP